MDIVKEMLDLGSGIVGLTRQKAEKIVNEMVKEGRLKKEESRNVIEKLISKAATEEKGLEKKLSKAAKAVFAKLDIATKRDIRRLESEINKLKARQR